MSTPNQPEPTDVPDAVDPVDGPQPGETSAVGTPDPAVAPRRSGLDSRGRVKRTRASTAWASAVALALITILFVIFVVQNSQSISIKFLWMDGQIAAASALLIAAVAGALLVAIPAAVRIGQLRHSLKKNA